MKTTHRRVKIKELVNGYNDKSNEDKGITSMNGALNIRPEYQREFVYKPKQRNAVIETILQSAPLNNMYWAENKDGFEIMDGQQRSISICQFVNNEYSHDGKYFHSLTPKKQDRLLNYELDVYVCEGTETEKYNWFERINIAGETLTEQELRNGVYVGSWLSDAKLKFSKPNCIAHSKGGKYLKGEANRQHYLETTIKWISNDNILDYMSLHQHDDNANELYTYFEDVIEWVESIFPKYDKVMKGIAWGTLYNDYKDKDLSDVHARVATLVLDEDVTNHKGIYSYLVTGKERYLNIRAFTTIQKASKYEEQEGECPSCGNTYSIDAMQGDHIKPWSLGGMTVQSNLQMLCKQCNRTKSNI